MFKPSHLAALLPLALTGCSIMGSGLTPYTPLEAQYSGTYEGTLSGLTGTSAARLVLSVSEPTGTASGVLTNLRSGKSYTFSGEFIPLPQGGSVSAKLFEKGDHHAANLTAGLSMNGSSARLEGRLKTLLLWQEVLEYQVSLTRVAEVGQQMPTATNGAPPPQRLR